MVSIVIPTLGRPSLDRLLRSIVSAAEKNQLEFDRDLEVVVSVDPRGSLALPTQFSRVRVVPSLGLGVNRARNAGARATRGEILWFLDDDTELIDDSGLRKLSSIFGDPALCAVGGNYVSAEAARFSERGYNSLCSLWRASAGGHEAEQLLGGTLAVRKSVWANVRGFDDHIEYGGAETAFVRRLIQNSAGEPRTSVRYDADFDVRHFPGDRGIRGWARIAFHQGRRKVETESTLPSFEHRVRRTVDFLKHQDGKTLVTLAVFSVPFLLVSKAAAISRR